MPDVTLEWDPEGNRDLWNRARWRGFKAIRRILSEESYSRKEILQTFPLSEDLLHRRTMTYDLLSLYDGKYFPKFQFLSKDGSTPSYFSLFNAAFLKLHESEPLSLYSFWTAEGYDGRNHFELLKKHDIVRLNKSLMTWRQQGAR